MINQQKNISPNPNTLLVRIKTAFPEITWQNFKYLDEGWDHEVVILDDKTVFRFPGDDEYLGLLKSEIKVLKKLKPLLKINIPGYTLIAQDESFAGYPIVPGITLSKEVFENLNIDDRNSIAKQLSQTISTLHTFGKEDFPEVVITDMPAWQQEMKDYTAKYLTNILSTDDMAYAQETITKVDEILRHQLHLTFIHGDIYSRHLLWDAHTKTLGLIDFSDMNIGDPAFDFAELYEYGADFVDEVYRHYKGQKDSTFLNRAKTYGKWVGIFMMTDHFMYHKTTFEIARQTFDRSKHY